MHDYHLLLFVYTKSSTIYGAIIDPIWEKVNNIPIPVFLIVVGYNSDTKRIIIENKALTKNFAIKVTHNKTSAFSENKKN
jgi:hypothetical protein